MHAWTQAVEIFLVRLLREKMPPPNIAPGQAAVYASSMLRFLCDSLLAVSYVLLTSGHIQQEILW